MKWLLKRDWNTDKKALLIQICTLVGIPWLLFILCKIKEDIFLRAFSYIFRVPQELYAFLGLTSEVQVCVWHYLLFPVVFLNAWAVWKNAVRAKLIIRREEHTKSIYLLCNQLYTRQQILLEKYIWSMAGSLGIHLLWGISLLVLASLTSADPTQKAANTGTALALLLIGCAVNLLVISVMFLYTVCKSTRKKAGYSSGADLLIFGTLALGNAYKLRDAFYLLMAKLKVEGDWLVKLKGILGWLEKLYWLSPLSWLNPYKAQMNKYAGIQIGICILLAAAFAVLTVYFYKKREF